MEQSDAPGWDAIDAALAPLYGGQEPHHFGTLIKWSLGGNDPIDGISAYRRDEPVPHWHFVTYGFSELYEKHTDDPDVSGFGFELTLRAACEPDETEPPRWALNFLQNLGRYVFGTGNAFDAGDWMPVNGPIATDSDTELVSIAFVTDPELPPIGTASGHLTFLQAVGLTQDEELAAKRWNAADLLATLEPRMPLWVTDLNRTSLLDDAAVRAQVDAGSRRDGSSTGFLFVEDLGCRFAERRFRRPVGEIRIRADQATEIAAILPLRLPFGKVLRLMSEESAARFEPATESGFAVDDQGVLVIGLTEAAAGSLAATLRPEPGSYPVEGLDHFRVVVT